MTRIVTYGKITLDEAWRRWGEGESIASLCEATGLKRGKLRRELTKYAGGKEEFKAARPANARRTTRKTRRVERRALEADLPMFTDTTRAAGWRVKAGRDGAIHVHPDGSEWIVVDTDQRADAIRIPRFEGDRAIRMQCIRQAPPPIVPDRGEENGKRPRRKKVKKAPAPDFTPTPTRTKKRKRRNK